MDSPFPRRRKAVTPTASVLQQGLRRQVGEPDNGDAAGKAPAIPVTVRDLENAPSIPALPLPGQRLRRAWKFDDQRRALFLELTRREGWQPTAHAAACGVSYPTVTAALAQEPDFAAQVEAARAEFIRGLEAEAWRRAVDGVEEPVTIAGLPDTRTRYSDSLLRDLLARHDPTNWSKRVQVDQTTRDADGELAALTPEGREAVRALVDQEKARREALDRLATPGAPVASVADPASRFGSLDLGADDARP